MTQVTQAPAKARAQIPDKTLRRDPWWRQPAVTAIFLAIVVIYLTWASLDNADYFWAPYISPLYSPCLATTCVPGSGFHWIPWLSALTPAIIIIGGPMGFRFTCYYYRKAYYRRSEEHTSELQSRPYLVCRLLLVKKKHNYT